MRLTLRGARPADARRLWRWANEPVTRQASHGRAVIPWPRHRRWFADQLARPETCRIYIVLLDSRPVAQIRYEKEKARDSIVSISVDAAARGKGVATRALRAGGRRAARDLGVRRVQAYIMLSNASSLSAFRRAGYRFSRRVRRKGDPSVLLVQVVGTTKKTAESRRSRR